MNKQKVVESGLLELYVMGCLDAIDSRVVDLALEKFPELKHELHEIEQALFVYANKFALAPNENLKSEILSQLDKPAPLKLTNKEAKPSKKNSTNFFTALMLAIILSLGILILNYNLNNKLSVIQTQFESIKYTNDSLASANLKMHNILNHLQSPNCKTLNINPTEGYNETKLVMHTNQKTKKNYLHLKEMPTLAANQSYQLWAIKNDTAPRPLDIFDGNNKILEVKYISGTKSYGITLEPKGGSLSPDLTKLIGVIPAS